MFAMAWSLVTVSATVIGDHTTYSTHCPQCQCGSSTASWRLKLCGSSVQPRSLSVVELVSDRQALGEIV